MRVSNQWYEEDQNPPINLIKQEECYIVLRKFSDGVIPLETGLTLEGARACLRKLKFSRGGTFVIAKELEQ